MIPLSPRATFGCVVLVAALSGSEARADIAGFIEARCANCHNDVDPESGLDLTALKMNPGVPSTFATWVLVHDRVRAGEMPPKPKARPPVEETRAFLAEVSGALTTFEQARDAAEGRATRRRLNRDEYAQTLREVLGLPDLEVKEFLPEDSEAHGFNKTADALDVSHVQLNGYLAAAEFALREAMAPTARPTPRTTVRYYAWEQTALNSRILPRGISNRRMFPLLDLELQPSLTAAEVRQRVRVTARPEREHESLGVVVSSYEPMDLRFSQFRAPVTGRYRLKFSGFSLWMSPDYTRVSVGRRLEPVTLYAQAPPRTLRKLETFDVGPQPAAHELNVFLRAGETIQPDAARLVRSRPPEKLNPLLEKDGMPGVAFAWLEVDGPINEQWPPASHRRLFGELPMKDRPTVGGEHRFTSPPGVDVTSTNPALDAERLLRGFLRRAYRGPVPEEDVTRFTAIVERSLREGRGFSDAMLAGYVGALSSPRFLFLDPQPGRLADAALGERLAYFLWNSPPDDELTRVAERNELHRPEVLHAQTERLLNDPRARRFIDAFLDYWLDLRHIGQTSPDAELYPDYQLDDLLLESVLEETRRFFGELIQRDLGVANLVASDFAMLNDRLAVHYGVPGVTGANVRAVKLPEGSLRGGLLTQASVLKITANGTTTSPVKRGAWIMSRLLGQPPSPPPAAVPAVEPDTRGATTIREQLDRHRSEEMCAGCHRKIDPVGFALESFDVMGGWRDRYRSLGEGEPVLGVGHHAQTFHFRLGPPVDSRGELADGRTFRDVADLKRLLLTDEEQLARNLVRQMIVYGTGGPVRFSDRPAVEAILQRARSGRYGIRTLIHEIVQSDLFLFR